MGIVKHNEVRVVEHDQRKRTRDVTGLRQELVEGNPGERRWAAHDLARHPEAAADLIARLPVEDDRAVREAIFISLTEIGTAEAVEGLVACLRSEDVELRNDAIEAMKSLPDVIAPIMTRLLADDDADVRIFAVNVLESLRHPDVESWLIRVIREDAHVNVCATAVDLLGEVGSEQAVEQLGMLKDRFPHEPYIAFAADLALKRIRGG